MSSWSRTIFVPLSIIYALKPKRVLPPGCSVRELFDGAPRAVSNGAPRVTWTTFFELVNKGLKLNEQLPTSAPLRKLALRKASEWMIARLEDSDGLGAILPAMTSSVIALKCLGYGDDHPLVREGLAHLEGLLLADPETGWLRVQPCLSPVWDTCLGTYALLQAGLASDHAAVQRAVSWLLGRQCRRPGDWCAKNAAEPGGWYFEFRNEFYPDVDDTCMALIVLQQSRAGERTETGRAAVGRGLTWMLGMQNDDGGWASFDRGVDKELLTHVPFADHNAMIDPSTADITGRVLECLAQFDGFGPGHPVVDRALRFLRSDQCVDGSWYGRWGVNYLYGTWQVLRGLRCIGEDLTKPYVRRAVRWLTDHQNEDGGWGESIASYDNPRGKGVGPSTPTQTAWALMGLIAAGDADGPAVRRGVRYLLDTQEDDGTWKQEAWAGTGFPKVFYLNYHYYRHYFPLMALAQYHESTFRK